MERRQVWSLDLQAAVHFRDELREARQLALRDAENFEELLFVVERLGSFLIKKIEDLARYAGPVASVAGESPLAKTVPAKWPQLHTRFGRLYDLVRDGRNSALHQGAFARHLTTHAVEMALILEHALMSKATKVGQFMVRTPACACLWQPVSFVRQTMLLNSYSTLPVRLEEDPDDPWRLVCDVDVARYLRSGTLDKSEHDRRLTSTLGDAFKDGGISLRKPQMLLVGDGIERMLDEQNDLPCLIWDQTSKELLGIITPFDLL